MISHDLHITYIFVGSRNLPFECCRKVQSAARREHDTLRQDIVQPVSTGDTLLICICLHIHRSCDCYMTVM